MDVCQNSGYCKEMAVVDRWLLVEVQLYHWKKNEVIVALHNSSSMNHDNCWIWFIILWGWSFLSLMIMLITVSVLGLYRCEFVNLHGSLFLKTPSVCNVTNSTWMHVESSFQASIRPKTSQITVKVHVLLEKNQQKRFQGHNILFLHY